MKALLSCFFWGLSLTVYANDDLTVNVTVEKPHFTVSVPANPTTGYQWSVVSFDEKLLTLNGSNFVRPTTHLIGAGGQMNFAFTLQKAKNYPKNTVIKLKYARSWEPQTGTLKKITVHIMR